MSNSHKHPSGSVIYCYFCFTNGEMETKFKNMSMVTVVLNRSQVTNSILSDSKIHVS